MAEDRDDAQKTELPTQKRLAEAEERGDVTQSPDIAAWLVLAVATGIISLWGGQVASGPPGQHAPVRISHIQRGKARRQPSTLPPPGRIAAAQESGPGHDAVPAVQARRRHHNRSDGHGGVLLPQLPRKPSHAHGFDRSSAGPASPEHQGRTNGACKQLTGVDVQVTHRPSEVTRRTAQAIAP